MFLSLYFVMVRNSNFRRYVIFNAMQDIVLDIHFIFPNILEWSFNVKDGLGLDLVIILDNNVSLWRERIIFPFFLINSHLGFTFLAFILCYENAFVR